MTKRLAELDSLDRRVRLDPLDSIDTRLEHLKRGAALRLPTPPTPPKKQHRFGAFVTLLVFALAVTGVVLVARRHGRQHAPAATTAAGGQHQALTNASANHDAASALTPSTANAPPPGVDEQASRLLPVVPAVPAQPGTGSYQLLNPSFGPPRYDPCRPIHYVIRDQHTPAGGDDTIRQAVAAVSKATGLRFIEDGSTTETPAPKRAAYLPARYGHRWAPVLIAWTSPAEIPGLQGKIEGLSGSSWYSANTGHGFAYVSGQLYLDAPQLSAAQAAPHCNVVVKLVIEHELGHLVGLAHVNDPTQIMNPSVQGLTDYRAGDLRGLSYEGSGACHPEL